MKIGEITQLTQDVETTKALSGEKTIIKKGTNMILTSKGFMKIISGPHKGKMMSVAEGEIDGVDCEGLAEYIAGCLMSGTEAGDILKDSEYHQDELKADIEYYLFDIF